MRSFKLFIMLACLSLGGFVNAQGTPASTPKYRILMDIAHGQIFWNDPADMEGKDPNQIGRVKYMTDQFVKTASSVNAELVYQKGEIKPGDLTNCDLLFIHIPSSKYSPAEIKAIIQYLQHGGALFVVMDEDYWATLEQTNVNDIINPFGLKYEGQSPDTLVGGYTKAGIISNTALKITYQGGRIVDGGTPFCFKNESDPYPFGKYVALKNGGKIIAMGDGMTSLYMTNWKGISDYQCQEFMHDAFKWLCK